MRLASGDAYKRSLELIEPARPEFSEEPPVAHP